MTNKMTRTELADRLRYAGLAKKDLAKLLGQTTSHVSQLGKTTPVGKHVLSIIAAWEFMSPMARRQWLNGE